LNKLSKAIKRVIGADVARVNPALEVLDEGRPPESLLPTT
jgi:hypothetical protein